MIPLPTDPLPSVVSSVRPVDDSEVYACRAVIEALPPGRYASALQVGCGTGVLTRYLASECDTLLAVDGDRRAVAQAELHCEDQPWVQFAVASLREDWPDTGFELIVIDDAIRRASGGERRLLAARLLTALEPGGTVLLRTGRCKRAEEQAADQFVYDCRPRLACVQQVLSAEMRIDLLR